VFRSESSNPRSHSKRQRNEKFNHSVLKFLCYEIGQQCAVNLTSILVWYDVQASLIGHGGCSSLQAITLNIARHFSTSTPGRSSLSQPVSTKLKLSADGSVRFNVPRRSHD